MQTFQVAMQRDSDAASDIKSRGRRLTHLQDSLGEWRTKLAADRKVTIEIDPRPVGEHSQLREACFIGMESYSSHPDRGQSKKLCNNEQNLLSLISFDEDWCFFQQCSAIPTVVKGVL